MSPMSDDILGPLQDSLRRFIEKEIAPKADAWEAQGICRSVTWPRSNILRCIRARRRSR